MKTEREIQQEELARVRLKIEAAVVKFAETVPATREGRVFHMYDLTAAVLRAMPATAPDSPSRILRNLRQQKRLNYRVLSRRNSLYELIDDRLF